VSGRRDRSDPAVPIDGSGRHSAIVDTLLMIGPTPPAEEAPMGDWAHPVIIRHHSRRRMTGVVVTHGYRRVAP
jgi:hypothetical protein